MCEMVEYASMRFMFVCEIATILPIAIDNTASITSMPCQSDAAPASASANIRMTKPNAAIFGADAMNKVIAVGAPS